LKDEDHLLFWFLFEAKHLWLVETPVPPPSTISFCSIVFHKKDAVPVGAILEASVARGTIDLIIKTKNNKFNQ